MRGRTTLPAAGTINPTPRIMVYDYRQDDPKKCTSAKLQQFHIARPLRALRQIPNNAVVLNPISNTTLSFQDRELIERHGLVGLDCSWNQAERTLERNLRGENRRLPTLLAGNPTNYSSRGKLSTAEALAAALIITGFDEEAKKIMRIFKWGDTFLSLNNHPLADYAKTPPGKMIEMEREYFSTL